MLARALTLSVALLLAACEMRPTPDSVPGPKSLDDIALSFGIASQPLHCQMMEDWVLPPHPERREPVARVPVRACWPAGSDTSLFVAYDRAGAVRRVQRRWPATAERYDSVLAALSPVLGTGEPSCFGLPPLRMWPRQWRLTDYYVILGTDGARLVLDYRAGKLPYSSDCDAT
jgi:hypothetical protein